MSKEAMKLALEALNNTYALRDDVIEAIKALEEALAKQEQCEPLFKSIIEKHEGLAEELAAMDKERGEPAFYAHDGYLMTPERAKFLGFPLDGILALYTTPQQRKQLTYEEIRKWWARDNDLEDCDMCKIDDFVKVVRAIEAAHGIKE